MASAKSGVPKSWVVRLSPMLSSGVRTMAWLKWLCNMEGMLQRKIQSSLYHLTAVQEICILKKMRFEQIRVSDFWRKVGQEIAKIFSVHDVWFAGAGYSRWAYPVTDYAACRTGNRPW